MVSITPRPHFTTGKDEVPISHEAGWASGPVWTGGKSRPHRDSIPARPARSSVAIPTELPDPHVTCVFRQISDFIHSLDDGIAVPRRRVTKYTRNTVVFG